MSPEVICAVIEILLGGAAGYALGVNDGMEVFKRILIDAFDKHLDDEDTLSVAEIKEIIRAKEDKSDE